MTTDLSRIGIVTVCYRSMAVLPEMLATISDEVPVVLIDNAGDDDPELTELATRHGAKLIVNGKNRGFGVACNQGAAELTTEFLLFLNPDAALAPDALERLLEAADAYPDAGAFNPKIASPQGAQLFKRNSHLFPKSHKMPRGWPAQDSEVTVLSGAAFFVRRSAFESVGGFDPNIFLYHEDDDLALRLRQSVGPLRFVSNARVTHLEGRSSVRSPEIATLKAWHMARSRVYATRKHGRPIPFARALHSAMRQLLSPAVLFSKRKRAKQVAYLTGVLSSFWDGGATREAQR
ncbi:glycosyltransferase family 2 protein [Shimia sp. CNT1-13L.2]|uniref:glycosyltransferase family 2 protein n=1 Tax=Shimia sp. CNT1-13L.2 TaxID=2959663 RepID=UPI0020CEC05B|nr:glycosyltransferase family 2 protein [Shimia sp. CNT1-13L.2]MCP9480874.1 glycosyltransferase family 2 protein [Shimia sp. CNT1-13L.2]